MSDRVITKLTGKIQIKHGFPFKSEHFSEAGEYVILTPGNFYEEGGFKRNAEKDKFYTASFPPEYLLKKGDLVVAMTEQAEGLLGSMAIVPEDEKFLHNQRLGLVTSRSPDVDLQFLYYLFQTKSIRLQVRRSATGSKVKHTSPDRLYDVVASLPQPETQKRIAKVLSTLDAKIDLNRRLNAELEALAKLLYDYWFVQFDFPISAAQAAAMGRPDLVGKPYRASGGKMVHNDELKREIPGGWEVGTLESLGTIVGGTTPDTKKPEYFSSEAIPWITPKDLSNNVGNRFIARGEIDVTEAGARAASLKELPEGTVLMSSRAPIGYLAVARNPVTTNQGFKSFIPNRGFCSEFVYFTLRHYMKAIEQNASGSTFKEVSASTLKMIRVHLPPVAVVEAFRGFASPLSSQQSTLEQQNEELTQLRDWLLPMLMNGQVTVGDVDVSPKNQEIG